LCFIFNSITQHVTSGQVANTEVVSDVWCLSSLAGAGWANENDVQGWFLGAFVAAFDFSVKIFKADVSKVNHECSVRN
jgi:hypothetical protein